MPPNPRFEPTASLAALASRRLKRVPLAVQFIRSYIFYPEVLGVK
jgi:hypothetical protein